MVLFSTGCMVVRIEIHSTLLARDMLHNHTVHMTVVFVDKLASSIVGSWHLPFLYHFWYKLPQGKIEWQSRVSFQLQSNLRCMTSHIWMLFWIAELHLLAISLQRHPMDSLEDCLLGHLMEDRREHLFQFFHARSIHTHAKVPWLHHSKDMLVTLILPMLEC